MKKFIFIVAMCMVLSYVAASIAPKHVIPCNEGDK